LDGTLPLPNPGEIRDTMMPQITRSDLRYDYNWQASPGDNPKLIEDDAHHLSRNEGYEMLAYLNGLSLVSDRKTIVYGKSGDMDKTLRLYIEWMLKEHYKSTAPGRGTVTKWVNENWISLKVKFTSLKPQK
jgi:hypothetical protein